MNGKLVWQADFGDKKMRNQFGEGSTPVLYGNTLVVVWDHLNQPSYVIALDKRTGKELWRVDHPEMDTWATPLVVDARRTPAGDRQRDESRAQLRSARPARSSGKARARR